MHAQTDTHTRQNTYAGRHTQTYTYRHTHIDKNKELNIQTDARRRKLSVSACFPYRRQRELMKTLNQNIRIANRIKSTKRVTPPLALRLHGPRLMGADRNCSVVSNFKSWVTLFLARCNLIWAKTFHLLPIPTRPRGLWLINHWLIIKFCYINIITNEYAVCLPLVATWCFGNCQVTIKITQNSWIVSLLKCISLPPYHDAFMHRAIHVLDAPPALVQPPVLAVSWTLCFDWSALLFL